MPRPGQTIPCLNLTSREAGQAATARAKLMLTHFWPGNDSRHSRARAAEVFSGILVAAEGMVVHRG